MNRLIAYLLVLITIPQIAAAAVKFSVLQGSTSDTVTHFTAVVRQGDDPQFFANSEGRRLAPEALEKVAYPGSEWLVYRMRFTGLSPKARYQLEAFENGKLTDQRNFTTLDITRQSGRVAVVSCMVRQLHNPFLWNNLAKPENRPDLLLLIGDSVYLDRDNLFVARNPTTGLQAWQSFAAARNSENLYFWENLVPVVSVWDDHDAGGNNVTAASFPLMPTIRRVYDSYFANEPIAGFLDLGPGMSKRFELFGKNWVILDGRSFRDLDPGSPMFGGAQEAWLMNSLQSGANFLVSGSQFYGKYVQKDSYEYNYPEAAARFTQTLRTAGQAKGTEVAFVSGDLHFSEVQVLESQLLGYPTWEITSSSAHSFGLPGHYLLKPFNPRRTQVTGTHNVVLMEFKGEPGFSFDVRSMGWRGGDLFKAHLVVDSGACEAELRSSTAISRR